MTDADYRDLMVYLGHLVFDVAIRIAALVLVIGIADYAYQKWQHNEDLKMTPYTPGSKGCSKTAYDGGSS